MTSQRRVAIIGAGAAGLSAGYHLGKAGWNVSLFEKDSSLGGLAGSFLLDGAYVEKFYHFICLQDLTYQQILKELNLHHLLRWRLTDMGHLYRGTLRSFGRPLDLLKFPYLSWNDKIRYAYNIMKIKSGPWENHKQFENIAASEWLLRTFGPNIYHALYEPLLRLKFGDYLNQLSASWLWARIYRLGKSRTRIRQREKVGYVEGGSQIIMDALGDSIRKMQGTITLQATVDRLLIENNSVRGLVVNGREQHFDFVISTVPLPAFLRLIPPDLKGDYWDVLRRIESVGVICLFIRSSKKLSPFFWTNISDEHIQLAGIIEYTNLNPLPHLKGDSIIYLPQYLSANTEKFFRSDEEIIREYLGYLKMAIPNFSEQDAKMVLVFREKYAQPICNLGFTKEIPSFRTAMKGLYLTDSSQLHPDDRTISNSLGLGISAANLILSDSADRPAGNT